MPMNSKSSWKNNSGEAARVNNAATIATTTIAIHGSVLLANPPWLPPPPAVSPASATTPSGALRSVSLSLSLSLSVSHSTCYVR
ncbi:MAG: hypothetical protein LUD39_02590 [Opitutae bacterium]|nr:hypothetical protein [Opitutae bacterium]